MKKKLQGLGFYIKTYGCQMNVYDSDKISLLLEQQGMIEKPKSDEADLVILNTCHIREKAKHKIYTELGYLRVQKKQRAQKGKRFLIAVGGCVAQAEGSEVLKAAPFVDIVFGTQSYHHLPELIEAAWKGKDQKALALQTFSSQNSSGNSLPSAQIINIDFPQENKFQFLPHTTKAQGTDFLAIQEGCDKFCTYCVVPYTRGAEVSRSVSSILEEAQRMVEKGIQEITLLGQNVNAYNGKGPHTQENWSFSQLIRTLHNLKGLKRIFYTSSHPLDVSLDLIKAHAELPKLMPFWHLPVQSGSTRILQAMNRRHTADEYKKIIDTIRHYNPHIALSSDFIVGFPGETESDFEETLDLVRYVHYAQAFSFKYSPRPGTLACDLPDPIDEDLKSKRLKILQDLLKQQQIQFNQKCRGKIVSVMFQKYGKEPHQILGKSEFMQSVIVHTEQPELYINTIHKVKVTGSTLSCLEGVIV